LRHHVYDFPRFFFPAVAEQVDLETAPEFLDTELKRFSRGNTTPDRLAVLLVKVRRKTGEEELLYCHVEVQGRRDDTFELRLLQYAYRILDRLGRLPVTLAVLTDVEPGVKLTGHYRLEPIPGNSLTLEYRVVKLLDLEGRVAAALAEYQAGRAGDLNIFAAVVDVHLRTQRERRTDDWRDDRYRYELKRRLTDEVVHRYRQDARMAADVLRFLDWLIALPRTLDVLYFKEVLTMEEDRIMAFVTSWERLAEERGILKDKRQTLERLITRKFGTAPEDHDLIDRCDDPERLDVAVDTVIDATTKDEVLQHIR
jgi:hypothetical protein